MEQTLSVCVGSVNLEDASWETAAGGAGVSTISLDHVTPWCTLPQQLQGAFPGMDSFTAAYSSREVSLENAGERTKCR